MALIASAEGVGVAGVALHLACDLARSGSKPYPRGRSDSTEVPDFAAGSRQIAGKPAPTPSAEARSKKQLRSQ
jgi:hypothetical protein